MLLKGWTRSDRRRNFRDGSGQARDLHLLCKSGWRWIDTGFGGSLCLFPGKGTFMNDVIKGREGLLIL